MLLPKIGCVAAHPANVHRLLYDEEQLVLVFPEGRKGTEKLYKDRYRLRRFGRGGFVEAAMRARTPIVPVCVVGAEEAAPVFAQIGLLKRAHRAALLPDHADLPALRPARHARLPARQVQAALPRADPLRRAATRTRTRRSSRRWPTRSARASRRTSGTCSPSASRCGSDEHGLPADTRHRALDLLGRAARAGARGVPRGRGGDRRRQRGARRSSSSAPST